MKTVLSDGEVGEGLESACQSYAWRTDVCCDDWVCDGDGRTYEKSLLHCSVLLGRL